jgi:hypothetical protein
MEFEFEGAETTRLVRKESRQQSSALRELGKMERWGAKLFIGGDIIGFRGTAQLGNPATQAQAIRREKGQDGPAQDDVPPAVLHPAGAVHGDHGTGGGANHQRIR